MLRPRCLLDGHRSRHFDEVQQGFACNRAATLHGRLLPLAHCLYRERVSHARWHRCKAHELGQEANEDLR
jgi:hypothetical protein